MKLSQGNALSGKFRVALISENINDSFLISLVEDDGTYTLYCFCMRGEGRFDRKIFLNMADRESTEFYFSITVQETSEGCQLKPVLMYPAADRQYEMHPPVKIPTPQSSTIIHAYWHCDCDLPDQIEKLASTKCENRLIGAAKL